MTKQVRREPPIAGRCLKLALVLLVCAQVLAAAPLEITGVEPYAMDQPRVPALLTAAGGGAPLSYQNEMANQRAFAFDWFLDTAASRMVLSKAYRTALGVRATGQTVEDWGIGGTEMFDVSVPYQVSVGNSNADPGNLAHFPFKVSCSMQLRRSDANPINALPKGMAQHVSAQAEAAGMTQEQLGEMFTESMNIVGTPFLEKYVAILDPRPTGAAFGAVLQMMGGGLGDGKDAGFGDLDKALDKLAADPSGGGMGQVGVMILPPGQTYPATEFVVPLALKLVTPKPVPVTEGKIPFITDITLENGGRKAKVSLALDTGGAISLISTRLAQELGLDLAHPDLTAFIQGVGKDSPELKGYWIPRMTVSTRGGAPIIYYRAPFFVADVTGVDGTFGANLILPSVFINVSGESLEKNPMGILSGMRPGPMPFRRIVLDFPNSLLGLDSASKAPEGAAPQAPKGTRRP